MSGPAAGDGVGILRAQPHGRTDVPATTNDLNSVRMVAGPGNHVQRHDHRDHGFFIDLGDGGFVENQLLTLWVLLPVPVVGSRCGISAK